jgi:1-acyl-sn-glycerol-3-phosphate acyltransferase
VSHFINYSLLLGVRTFARTFYRFDVKWVAEPPADLWQTLRIVAILNHTSLYEPLLAGGVPTDLMRRIAYNGIVPVADKTLKRPLVGRFFRLVAPDVVPITRQRDQTWTEVTQRIGGDSMVIILPEGRMKRANGLDKDGKPMTVRGGIADLVKGIPGGRMLLAYSGGLHHVQVPGQTLPKLFKKIQLRLEVVDVAEYREEISRQAERHEFKLALIRDLERRRDLHCAEMESCR